MRIASLHLKAFGPFTDRVVDLEPNGRSLTLIYGPNEAGKSSLLRAVSAVRFGIPQQTSDNFIHAYSDLRVGGEFIDHTGDRHVLMRRKGRGQTLLHTGAVLDAESAAQAASAEIERLLTRGMSREEYESAFSLDHLALRTGGEALLKGEGEIGAALFEASAGTKSIPELLERLDQISRGFFVPGSRGKAGKINEALAAFDVHQSQYREAIVRPAQWAGLFKGHQDARERVQMLESEKLQLHSKQLLLRELRSVAPILAGLDHAEDALGRLSDAVILPEDAASERAAAETGRMSARHQEEVARTEFDLQSRILDQLPRDVAILSVSRSVRRLEASMDGYDRCRSELNSATSDVNFEQTRISDLAAQICRTDSIDPVLARIPTSTERARIEEIVRRVEQARAAFVQHSALQRRLDEEVETVVDPLPASDVLAAFRAVVGEAARNEHLIESLRTLPLEIASAQRAYGEAMVALGLPPEGDLRDVHPLLDAKIDEAMERASLLSERQQELERQQASLVADMTAERRQLDSLRAHGAVATVEDVEVARLQRDETWATIRSIYIEGATTSRDNFAPTPALPVAYEESVREADRLSDEVAKDRERAILLRSTQQKIADSELRQRELAVRTDELERESLGATRAWRETLVHNSLPVLSPAELRDWQSLLPNARAISETRSALSEELIAVRARAELLSRKIADAIPSVSTVVPDASVGLEPLYTMAQQMDHAIRQREIAASAVAGKQQERARRRQQSVAVEAQLKQEVLDAEKCFIQIASLLFLSVESSVELVRTRLSEFDRLVEAKARLDLSAARVERASRELSTLHEDAASVSAAIDDGSFHDLRLYVERLVDRLNDAERIERDRALAASARDIALASMRGHQQTFARLDRVLRELCAAAHVHSEGMLPEAEERSRRKREAQADLDRSSRQLLAASTRSREELRTLLARPEFGALESEEVVCREALAALEQQLSEARGNENTARSALDAIDSADLAAGQREAMELAAATVRANVSPWIRTRIAHALLSEALKRFRDRAQGPMLRSASASFDRMTGGRFTRLVSDDSGASPVLVGVRNDGTKVHVDGMSEGTRDQLYLALRLAALQLRREAGFDLPVILDDILSTSDDDRTVLMLSALADFASASQVLVFTHHRHLIDIARNCLRPDQLTVAQL